ncbi:hypothetical protein [Spirosoma pollinicola]|uniref:Uncharacterized protein n=1 Tax=Spirosoma pollinicola TaxID=2057025 RepID=A0A2K8YTI4_9BACT|nr:hypothetical protein [Spirosoma pollinicola]AUD00945.1 hypothetical protein CWM47_03405 [Spirosoma pollinicola]
MLNFFSQFGLMGKWFTRIILGVGIFLLLRWVWIWFWYSPENWNGTAESYKLQAEAFKRHIDTLQADSTNKHLDIINLEGVIVMKDSALAKAGREYRKLEGEIQKALAYGAGWKDKFTRQVASSDKQVEIMTNPQRQQALQTALEKNGTLPLSPVLLTFNSPIVVKASLQTANREKIQRDIIDTLGNSVGHYKAATERLGSGLVMAKGGLIDLSRQAQANQKGGIPILRHRAVKQNKQIQAKADTLIKKIDEVSDLEKDLNKKSYEN